MGGVLQITASVVPVIGVRFTASGYSSLPSLRASGTCLYQTCHTGSVVPVAEASLALRLRLVRSRANIYVGAIDPSTTRARARNAVAELWVSRSMRCPLYVLPR